jgi:hypothetical protein
MASLTLAIPENLRRKIKEFKYINWSEVARAAIVDKLQLLEKMDKLLSKSALTEKDSLRYGRMIKKRQWANTKRLIS